MSSYSTGSKACKLQLCHGPLASSASTAMVIQKTASRRIHSAPAQVDCHANCLVFACPGCIEKDRTSYQILNLKNHIYDYHCGTCMEEVPPSRRGSVESAFGSIGMSSAGSREIC